MSKIRITNLTEGYLVVNSIQNNNNKLSIPPRSDAVVDAEYEDDSHIQELVRMKKIKVSSGDAPQKKAGSQAKSSKKDQAGNEDSKATFMSAQGSPKKAAMVNDITKDKVKASTIKGPMIDEQDEDEDDKPSEAFVAV